MARLRGLALVVAACLLALGFRASAVSPVGATATAIRGTLSASHPVLTFKGRMHNPAPIPMASDPDPTVCLINCQLWSLQVATTSPFLLSLHNDNSSLDDGFNVYVFDPAGQQVASSTGIGSNGQAAVVRPTTKGTYTVAVTMTYAYDVASGYLGEARLMTGRSWSQVRCPTRAPCP